MDIANLSKAEMLDLAFQKFTTDHRSTEQYVSIATIPAASDAEFSARYNQLQENEINEAKALVLLRVLNVASNHAAETVGAKFIQKYGRIHYPKYGMQAAILSLLGMGNCGDLTTALTQLFMTMRTGLIKNYIFVHNGVNHTVAIVDDGKGTNYAFDAYFAKKKTVQDYFKDADFLAYMRAWSKDPEWKPSTKVVLINQGDSERIARALQENGTYRLEFKPDYYQNDIHEFKQWKDLVAGWLIENPKFNSFIQIVKGIKAATSVLEVKGFFDRFHQSVHVTVPEMELTMGFVKDSDKPLFAPLLKQILDCLTKKVIDPCNWTVDGKMNKAWLDTTDANIAELIITRLAEAQIQIVVEKSAASKIRLVIENAVEIEMLQKLQHFVNASVADAASTKK